MKFIGTSLAALMFCACGRGNIDNKEAVQRGIIQDVSKRADVNSMDVTVTSVSFRGKEADAVVAFAPKGGPVRSGITMRYTLERSGNEWKVKGRSQADIKRHAGGASKAPGEGGEMRVPSGQLPSGHPRIDNPRDAGSKP
ncbi:MAG: hypothetical protein M3Z85_05990 [Acidobacteriota bacterium]|nr:hypothetical protein [Acidobacteriota bacterium]